MPNVIKNECEEKTCNNCKYCIIWDEHDKKFACARKIFKESKPINLKMKIRIVSLNDSCREWEKKHA